MLLLKVKNLLEIYFNMEDDDRICPFCGGSPVLKISHIDYQCPYCDKYF
jgi:uncharacterized Zn-finger protein